MKPTPAEAEHELLLTMARVFRAYISDPTPRAEDHRDFQAIDEAIKRVEASEAKPAAIPGGRPDGGMLYPIGDAAS